MANEIWVYSAFDEPNDLGLLGKAQALAFSCCAKTAAVCCGKPKDCSALSYSGADLIYTLGCLGSDTLQALALADLCRTYKPEILLFPATIIYSAVAARTAALLGTGLTADCTALCIEKNHLLRQTRPAFGGGLIADIYCKEKRPQMATVRPGTFPNPLPDLENKGVFMPFTPSKLPPDPAVLLKHEQIPPKKDLREARIIVAGGKGIGSRSGFNLLGELAEKIGGLVGASRSAVDAGYADYDCQIGQTGLFVSPDLFLAFGISGAPQHIAGMNSSGKVIAVNSDPKAPIFDYADLAIVGDWWEAAEKMLEGS